MPKLLKIGTIAITYSIPQDMVFVFCCCCCFLAAPGLSCDTQDLRTSLWHANSQLIKPRPRHWGCGVLATGPPGKSQDTVKKKERRWRRKWQPTPVFLPRKFHRQRNLCGHKENTTELLTTGVRMGIITNCELVRGILLGR